MKKNNKNQYITAVVASENGEIFDIEGYAATAMSGEYFTPLTMENTIETPFGSEQMLLPDRKPIVYNIHTEELEVLERNPYNPDEKIYPVAVFNSPGYVNSGLCAYEESENSGFLPLFSYGATGWGSDSFRSAAILIDNEKRQDLRLMPEKKVNAGVKNISKKYPENRLAEHLKKCAQVYGCPAAKNFFIGRCEAPLPASQHCNANCLGCISLQKTDQISCCQDRIQFTPTPDEIYEIAMEHITRVETSVVSFGQGCEGDPLFATDSIQGAVEKIRASTDKGTININTNGSRPEMVAKLFDAGMDSMRVSMNSVRKECYTDYFRPSGYTFEDVMESISIAGKKGGFISINYLNAPGVTDTPEEFNALQAFLEKYPVNYIQWRNLNYDPRRYYEVMAKSSQQSEPLGMQVMIEKLKKIFPNVKHGYFNPAKEKWITKNKKIIS